MDEAKNVLALLDNAWRVVSVVTDNPGLTQKELIEIHNSKFSKQIAQTTFSNFCNSLEEMGLFAREDVGNTVRFSPTDKLIKIFTTIKKTTNVSSKQKPI